MSISQRIYQPSSSFSSFFFFQAEDGIRDLTVTGVQTCALPIFTKVRAVPKTPGRTAIACHGSPRRGRTGKKPLLPPSFSLRRSEERRVGKECRARWEPYE